MDKRTEFVEQLSAQMVEWEVEIERLQDQAETATAEERADYARTIGALQLKRDQAAEKLQGISTASDDEWEEMKSGAEQIWDEVKELLRESLQKIR